MVDSCIYTYVEGCTGEYAVANTVVVYACNMWYPCTLYAHVYTQYVLVNAMNIHVFTSCLNMVGRVPLIPLFLAGNSTPTIPQQYNQTRGMASQWAAVALQQLMAGVAAMCMR
jgi:hypothetical protein